jgi:hypothetical protein
MKSVLVMLVVLEGPQKFVVFGKGLHASRFRHVEVSIVQLLPPKCYPLLLLVPAIRLHQLAQFLVTCYLTSFLEAQRLSQVVVHILRSNRSAILIVHIQATDPVLIQRLGHKCSLVSGLEMALSALLLFSFLLVFDTQLYLSQVLH